MTLKNAVAVLLKMIFRVFSFSSLRICTRGVQEPESDPEQEPELSKFFRSRIGLGVKFNVKTGVGVGAGVTIF